MASNYRLSLLAFLLLCVNAIKGQNEIQELLDSAKATLNSSPLDGLSAAEKAISMAIELDSVDLAYKGFLIKAWCYGYANQPENAKPIYTEGVSYLQSKSKPTYIGNLYMNLGVDYMLIGLNDSSLVYHLKSLPYYEESGNKTQSVKVLNNLGMLYKRINYFSKSIALYKKSIAVKEEIQDSVGLCTGYLNLSSVYFHSNKPDSCIMTANTGIALSQKIHNQETEGAILMNRGLALKAKNDMENAMKDFVRAEKLLKGLSQGASLLNLYENLAFFYASNQNLDSTKHYLTLAEGIPKKFWTVKNHRIQSLSKAKYFQLTGDLELSNSHWKDYAAYTDSVFVRDQMIRMSELSAQYEDEKQKSTIAKQNLELAQSDANAASLKTLVIGVVSALLILLLLYIILLLRNRKAKALAEAKLKTQVAEINSLHAQVASLSEIPLPSIAMSMTKEEVNALLVNPLSDRELEVLSALAQGNSYKEMAEEMHVSVNTIKTHISRIYGKLDVKNRTEATLKASSLNLLRPKN